MKQKGFTLIEALVSVLIVALIAMVAAKVVVDQKKNQKQISFLEMKKEVTEEIESELASYRQCSEMLQESLKTFPEFPNSFSQTVPALYFDDRFYHPVLKIEEVTLSYQVSKNADARQDGSLKTYRGFLDITLTPRDERARESLIQLKSLHIPLTILDKSGQGLWSDVVCADTDTQANSFVSEACAYYGGTLIDGTHCDFSRYMRRHRDVGQSAVPLVPVNDGTLVDGKPQTARMSLPDVMCYLDTLTTMIPDVTFRNRNPSLNRIDQDRTTWFCKRPGKVRKSPGPPDLNLILKTMSFDVRSYFTEVHNEP